MNRGEINRRLTVLQELLVVLAYTRLNLLIFIRSAFRVKLAIIRILTQAVVGKEAWIAIDLQKMNWKNCGGLGILRTVSWTYSISLISASLLPSSLLSRTLARQITATL